MQISFSTARSNFLGIMAHHHCIGLAVQQELGQLSNPACHTTMTHQHHTPQTASASMHTTKLMTTQYYRTVVVLRCSCLVQPIASNQAAPHSKISAKHCFSRATRRSSRPSTVSLGFVHGMMLWGQLLRGRHWPIGTVRKRQGVGAPHHNSL